MNVENILRVADAIEQHSIPDLGFNMGSFVSDSRQDRSHFDCGTTACIAGWACAVVGGYHLNINDQEWIEEQAREILDLSFLEADDLFIPTNHHAMVDDRILPDQAVRTLRRLAKTGVVDWDLPETDTPATTA